MNNLVENFAVSLYVYQIAFLLHVILVAFSIYYILKNKDRLKNPYVIIVVSILFPFVVSILAIVMLRRKE
jgi:hypothetical protein